MNSQQWYYFLSIERDFIRTIDFVELHPDNNKTFSNEYAKLLLLIGSEVDVVAKLLCNKVASGQKAANIENYKAILTRRFVGIHSVEIKIPRYSTERRPWLMWDPSVGESPDWWGAYNRVKHQRDIHYAGASQNNTISALCGLFALLLYLHSEDDHLQPYPELLDNGFPSYIVSGNCRNLPGT